MKYTYQILKNVLLKNEFYVFLVDLRIEKYIVFTGKEEQAEFTGNKFEDYD